MGGRHGLIADQHPTVGQTRHDDQRAPHVLGQIHEPGRHLIKQRLLLGVVERPSQRDQSIDLVYRDEGRTPCGTYEPIEGADDLSAGDPARADGMRARFVDVNLQPLEQSRIRSPGEQSLRCWSG